MNGRIFNIQQFSVHDGPGIRTVVFLKGCPMRCLWCGNPESQISDLQVAWTAQKCIHCSNCVNNCSDISFQKDGKLQFENAVLKNSHEAERICPSGALHVIGEEISVDEVITAVKKDMVFYKNSNGGITLSGGEPLMQPDFVYELLIRAKKEGIHCAMETSGFADWNVLKKIAGLLDYLLIDIKSVDDKVHQEQTGVSNKRILENFKEIYNTYEELPIHVRTPIIPGFNDDTESIAQILDFLEPYKRVKYELLQYHKFGIGKYISLGREYRMPDGEISDEFMKELNEMLKERRHNEK